jgi:hypothetical protein
MAAAAGAAAAAGMAASAARATMRRESRTRVPRFERARVAELVGEVYEPVVVLCAKVHIAAYTHALSRYLRRPEEPQDFADKLFSLFAELRAETEKVLEERQFDSGADWKDARRFAKMQEGYSGPAVRLEPAEHRMLLQRVAAALLYRIHNDVKFAKEWRRVHLARFAGTPDDGLKFRHEVDFIELVSLNPDSPHWFDDHKFTAAMVPIALRRIAMAPMMMMIKQIPPEAFMSDANRIIAFSVGNPDPKAGLF